MYCLKYSQKIPLTLEECWDYFSSPMNLKNLTPEYLGFEITNNEMCSKMYPGQIIVYRIRPLILSLEWVTEITQVEKPHYFVDEQRFGPYKFWHHEHRFYQIPNGVEIIDTVYYKLPFSIFGKILHFFKIRKDLEKIFVYRAAKLKELFGSYNEHGK